MPVVGGEDHLPANNKHQSENQVLLSCCFVVVFVKKTVKYCLSITYM